MNPAFQAPCVLSTDRRLGALPLAHDRCHTIAIKYVSRSSGSSSLRAVPNASTSEKSSHCRRDFLLATVAATAAAISSGSAPAQGYSSPYRPGESPTPLPNRLYEKSERDIVTTATGLQYFDLAVGSGVEAGTGDTVVVNYTSRLRGLNGIKVASSFDDAGSPPFVFKVGAADVVPGVSEAVTGMRVGGKRRAVLPPDIAYASPDMKPSVTEFFARRRLLSVLETNRDATIVFDLELLKVK